MNCEQCGEAKPVRLVKDPYLEEVWPDAPNEPEWWCDDCYAEAVDDV